MGCCGGVFVVVEDVGAESVVGRDLDYEDHGGCCEGGFDVGCFALVAEYG